MSWHTTLSWEISTVKLSVSETHSFRTSSLSLPPQEGSPLTQATQQVVSWVLAFKFVGNTGHRTPHHPCSPCRFPISKSQAKTQAEQTTHSATVCLLSSLPRGEKSRVWVASSLPDCFPRVLRHVPLEYREAGRCSSPPSERQRGRCLSATWWEYVQRGRSRRGGGQHAYPVTRLDASPSCKRHRMETAFRHPVGDPREALADRGGDVERESNQRFTNLWWIPWKPGQPTVGKMLAIAIPDIQGTGLDWQKSKYWNSKLLSW